MSSTICWLSCHFSVELFESYYWFGEFFILPCIHIYQLCVLWPKYSLCFEHKVSCKNQQHESVTVQVSDLSSLGRYQTYCRSLQGTTGICGSSLWHVSSDSAFKEWKPWPPSCALPSTSISQHLEDSLITQACQAQFPCALLTFSFIFSIHELPFCIARFH